MVYHCYRILPYYIDQINPKKFGISFPIGMKAVSTNIVDNLFISVDTIFTDSSISLNFLVSYFSLLVYRKGYAIQPSLQIKQFPTNHFNFLSQVSADQRNELLRGNLSEIEQAAELPIHDTIANLSIAIDEKDLCGNIDAHKIKWKENHAILVIKS